MQNKSIIQLKKLKQQNEYNQEQIKKDKKLAKNPKELEIKRKKTQEIALNKSLGINIKNHSIDFSKTCVNINNQDKEQLNGLMKNQQNQIYTSYKNYTEFNNTLIPSQKGLKGYYQLKQDYQNDVNPLYKKSEVIEKSERQIKYNIPSNIQNKDLKQMKSQVFKFQLNDEQWKDINQAPQSNLKRPVPISDPNYQYPFNKKNRYPLTVKPAIYSYDHLPNQLQHYLKQSQNNLSTEDSIDSVQYNYQVEQEMQIFRQNQKKFQKKGFYKSIDSTNQYFGGHFFDNPGFNFRTQEQMVDLSHIMYAANYNSPLTSHIKKSSTFGRSNKDLLKISQYMDKENYIKKIHKDKLNSIRPEIRLKMLDPQRPPSEPFPGKLQSKKFSLEMQKNISLNNQSQIIKQSQILQEDFLKNEKSQYEKQNIKNSKYQNMNQKQTDQPETQFSNFFSTQPVTQKNIEINNQDQLINFQNSKIKANQKIYSSTQGFKTYQQQKEEHDNKSSEQFQSSQQLESKEQENNSQQYQNEQVKLNVDKNQSDFQTTTGKFFNSQQQTWYQTKNDCNFNNKTSNSNGFQNNRNIIKSIAHLNRVTVGDGFWLHGKNEQPLQDDDLQAKKLEEPQQLKYQKEKYYRDQEGIKFSENYKNSLKIKYQKQLKEPFNKKAGLQLNFIQKQNNIKRKNIYKAKKVQQINVLNKMSENEHMYSALYFNKNKVNQITKSLEKDMRENFLQDSYENINNNDYYSYI